MRQCPRGGAGPCARPRSRPHRSTLPHDPCIARPARPAPSATCGAGGHQAAARIGSRAGLVGLASLQPAGTRRSGGPQLDAGALAHPVSRPGFHGFARPPARPNARPHARRNGPASRQRCRAGRCGATCTGINTGINTRTGTGTGPPLARRHGLCPSTPIGATPSASASRHHRLPEAARRLRPLSQRRALRRATCGLLESPARQDLQGQ